MDENDKTEDLAEVSELWDNAQEFYSQQVNRWATNERLANSKHITERKPGRSSLFVPKIQGYIRRKTADYMANFAKKSPITVRDTITSTASGARIMQDIINYYLDSRINYTAVIYNGAVNALTYNYAPAYIDWEVVTEEEETDQQEVDDNGMPTGKLLKAERVLSSSPTITIIPPEDFRLDPSVSWDEVDDARYIAFRTYVDRAYYNKKVEMGEWEKVDDSFFEYQTSIMTANTTLKAERSSTSSPFSKDMFVEDNGLIEIRKHFFYEEQENGDLLPVKVETLGDVEILSSATPLQYGYAAKGEFAWPFVVGTIYPKPHEQYAPALPEQAEDLQLEINAIRNQRRDNVSLILNPEKLITPDSGVNPSSLSFSYPGKVTVCTNPRGIVWQVPPDVTSSGHNEEKVSVMDMDRLFSEGPQRVGSPEVRKETATASQNMASGASASANLDLTMFGNSFVHPLITKLAALIIQAADQELFAKAAVKAGLNVQDAYLQTVEGDYQYSVFAGTMQSELNNEIGNASNIAGLIQTMYGPNANYRPILDSVLDAAGLDINQVLAPTPQAQQQGLPDQSQTDMGGVQPGGTPSIQPRVQFQGGQFGSGTGKQG